VAHHTYSLDALWVGAVRKSTHGQRNTVVDTYRWRYCLCSTANPKIASLHTSANHPIRYNNYHQQQTCNQALSNSIKSPYMHTRTHGTNTGWPAQKAQMRNTENILLLSNHFTNYFPSTELSSHKHQQL